MTQILIDEIKIPVIVDAGIGKPSDASQAMEMGADAVAEAEGNSPGDEDGPSILDSAPETRGVAGVS